MVKLLEEMEVKDRELEQADKIIHETRQEYEQCVKEKDELRVAGTDLKDELDYCEKNINQLRRENSNLRDERNKLADKVEVIQDEDHTHI